MLFKNVPKDVHHIFNSKIVEFHAMVTLIQGAMVVSMPSHTNSMLVSTEPIPVIPVSIPSHRPEMYQGRNDAVNPFLKTIPWVDQRFDHKLAQCMQTLVATKHLQHMTISIILLIVLLMITEAAQHSSIQLLTSQKIDFIVRLLKLMA